MPNLQAPSIKWHRYPPSSPQGFLYTPLRDWLLTVAPVQPGRAAPISPCVRILSTWHLKISLACNSLLYRCANNVLKRQNESTLDFTELKSSMPSRLGKVAITVLMCRYLNEEKITIYIEHPVPIDPPVAQAPAPPMPLMLTAKEKKKIRKQRREEREKERQVCIWHLPSPC